MVLPLLLYSIPFLDESHNCTSTSSYGWMQQIPFPMNMTAIAKIATKQSDFMPPVLLIWSMPLPLPHAPQLLSIRLCVSYFMVHQQKQLQNILHLVCVVFPMLPCAMCISGWLGVWVGRLATAWWNGGSQQTLGRSCFNSCSYNEKWEFDQKDMCEKSRNSRGKL